MLKMSKMYRPRAPSPRHAVHSTPTTIHHHRTAHCTNRVPLVTELAGGKLQVPVGWCHTFCYSTFRAHRAATLLLPSLK